MKNSSMCDRRQSNGVQTCKLHARQPGTDVTNIQHKPKLLDTVRRGTLQVM